MSAATNKVGSPNLMTWENPSLPTGASTPRPNRSPVRETKGTGEPSGEFKPWGCAVLSCRDCLSKEKLSSHESRGGMFAPGW